MFEDHNGLPMRHALVEPDLTREVSPWVRWKYDDAKEFVGYLDRTSKDGDEKVPGFNRFEREVFGRFFSESVIDLEEVEPGARWAAELHDRADELPEFERLRNRSMGDSLWSGIAASAICGQLIEALPDPPEEMEDTDEIKKALSGLQRLLEDGVPCQDEHNEVANQIVDAENAAEQFRGQLDEAAIRQSLRAGVEKANSEIDETERALDAFSQPGTGGDRGGRGADMKARVKLANRIRSDAKLKQIMNEAGRLKAIAAQKQRTKAKHAKSEITNVEVGADLGRVLPHEMAKLASPALRPLFYQQFNERKLMQYQLEGKERATRGPILVLMDQSGSMGGQREIWAKAVTLAMLDIAVRQKRSFGVVLYNHMVCEYHLFPRGEVTDVKKLLDIMSMFAGGGTKFEPALDKAVELIKADGAYAKADVINISDGEAYMDKQWMKKHNFDKEELGFTSYGVLINAPGYVGALEPTCDKVVNLTDMQTDEEEATGLIFDV